MTQESPVTELVRRRYSCRIYATRSIDDARRAKLADFLSGISTGPLGAPVRFSLVAAREGDRTELKGLGTYGTIKNPSGFIVGAAGRGSRNLEDYGYRLEQAVLYATGLELGTCWLGGAFSKSSFAKRFRVARGEEMPAVAAVGLAAEDSRARDWIRRRAGSDQRRPWESLFFEERFGNPLGAGHAEDYAIPLEMVRLAPSASNKQPWRVIRREGAWHFYLERTRGYGKGSILFKLLRLADLQRVDMGIAMCHFELSAQGSGAAGRWVVDEPQIRKPNERTEYVATWAG